MSWFLEKVLPSVVSALITTAAIRLSHVRIKRHVTQTADRQTAELKDGSEEKRP